MPFFSFLIKDNIDLLNDFNIKPKQLYFSKSTKLWKILNNKNNNKILSVNREKRKKLNKIGNSVLFCLPPNIGLGDAIEYARALKSLDHNNLIKDFAIAFTDCYSFIFSDYFNLKNIYPFIVSKEDFNKYETIFHFTLEIKHLKNQKNVRSNIEKEIKKYFKIKDKSDFFIQTKEVSEIKKISIFPISNSPIRTMPPFLLNTLINFLKNFFNLEVYFDKNSEISNYVLDHTDKENIIVIDSENKESLVNSIKEVDYGIFMDSGPLHIAKLFNKKGILIESSVSSENLLQDYNKIISINNKFRSSYCVSPCGLTDLFNYNNKIGCYDSLKINSIDINNNNLFYLMNRRGVKDKYTSFVEKPVLCLQSLNVQTILNYIKKDLSI